MAIIVEDGTIVAGANSFISLNDADLYFEGRNEPSTWTSATDEAKESALLYAAAEIAWGYAWRGQAVQPYDHDWPFPRYALIDDDGFVYTYPNSESVGGSAVPRRVLDAQCELALGHLDEALNEAKDRGGDIKMEKVGSLAVEYFEGAPTDRTFPHVELLLAGLHHGKKSSGVMIQQLGFAG